eukprot:7669778-Karenia_brevis.AAC.1
MKDTTSIDATETLLRDTMLLLEAELVAHISSQDVVNFFFNSLEEAAARLLLSKALNVGFDHT